MHNSQGIMIMDGGQNARIEVDENGKIKNNNNNNKIKPSNELILEFISTGDFKVFDDGDMMETEIPKGISEDFTSESDKNPPVLSIPETESLKNENDNDDASVSMFQDESIEFLEDEQSLLELDNQESINDQATDNASVRKKLKIIK